MQLLRAGEGRRDRRRHPAARGLRARPRRPAHPRLGLDVRRDPDRGRAPARPTGRSVAHAHLRHLNPFPANTEEVLRSYRRVLIPEVNLGQLLMLIRAQLPDRRRRLQPGPRQAVPDRRDRRRGRAPPRGVNRHDRHQRPRRPRPSRPSRRSARRTRAVIAADPQGLRVRPGGPLVPRLRRLLDPRPDPEGDARLRLPEGEHRLHLAASAAPAGCRTT